MADLRGRKPWPRLFLSLDDQGYLRIEGKALGKVLEGVTGLSLPQESGLTSSASSTHIPTSPRDEVRPRPSMQSSRMSQDQQTPRPSIGDVRSLSRSRSRSKNFFRPSRDSLGRKSYQASSEDSSDQRHRSRSRVGRTKSTQQKNSPCLMFRVQAVDDAVCVSSTGATSLCLRITVAGRIEPLLLRHRLKAKMEVWRSALLAAAASSELSLMLEETLAAERQRAEELEKLQSNLTKMERDREEEDRAGMEALEKVKVSWEGEVMEAMKRRDEAEGKLKEALVSQQELEKENEIMKKEIQELKSDMRRMFTVDEVQERIEEACAEREKDIVERSNQDQVNDVKYKAMYERAMSDMAHQQLMASKAIEGLEEMLRDEMTRHRTLKIEVEQHKLEAVPAIGEYKSLLLRHEDLWKKHKNLQSSYQMLMAAHDKEATAHKRLARQLRGNAIPGGHLLPDELVIDSPLLKGQTEFNRTTDLRNTSFQSDLRSQVDRIKPNNTFRRGENVTSFSDMGSHDPALSISDQHHLHIPTNSINGSLSSISNASTRTSEKHSMRAPSPPQTVINAPLSNQPSIVVSPNSPIGAAVTQTQTGSNTLVATRAEETVMEPKIRRLGRRASDTTLDALSQSMDATDSALVYTTSSRTSITSGAFNPVFRMFDKGIVISSSLGLKLNSHPGSKSKANVSSSSSQEAGWGII
ncbi:hypothetical protein HDU97_004384 [Phlyctochytrium planicorne]|nr:hypothetical protein HDU97_004384 [Phlyctochytrium planicorne]